MSAAISTSPTAASRCTTAGVVAEVLRPRRPPLQRRRSPDVIGIPLSPRPIETLAQRHGGDIRNGIKGVVRRLVPITRAAAGDLTVLLSARYIEEALRA